MSDHKRGGILYITDHNCGGNYLPKVLEAARHNLPKPGTVNHISIAHDDWCDLLSGNGPCNCEPEVQMLGVEQ
jgi:hypothetical protein